MPARTILEKSTTRADVQAWVARYKADPKQTEATLTLDAGGRRRV